MAEVMSPEQPVPLDTIPVDRDGDVDSPTDGAAQDGDIVTVFHDPDNFTVKHPLANKWTLWFTKPPSGKVRNTIFSKKSLSDDLTARLERASQGGHHFRHC